MRRQTGDEQDQGEHLARATPGRGAFWAGGGDDVVGRAELVEQVAYVGLGGVRAEAGVEMAADLGDELVALVAGQHAGDVVEASQVVGGQRVRGGHHVVPFARMSSTASRKRRHWVVKSARARRPSAVMA